MLLEDPKAVIEEPIHRLETPRANEDAQAIADEEATDEPARGKKEGNEDCHGSQ